MLESECLSGTETDAPRVPAFEGFPSSASRLIEVSSQQCVWPFRACHLLENSSLRYVKGTSTQVCDVERRNNMLPKI